MDIKKVKQLLIDQKEIFLRSESLVERKIEDNIVDLIRVKQIIVISGVRRSGKSSFLKLIVQNLLNRKISKDQIFYINFEDEFFVNFTQADFSLLLDAFYELNQLDRNRKIYCFFDEIQNINFWEKWVRKLYDLKNFKIFITGSNSSLLSKEIATSLTGRNYTLEIFPFSFVEYLSYKKIKLPMILDKLTSREQSYYKKKCDDFLINGGFPESINNPLNILEEYYKNIIYKDIVARFNIRNINEFRSTALYLMSTIASLMSYRSLAKMISGIDSSMTIKNYISYLEDTYLLFIVKKFEASVKKQIVNPFKIYGIDNGMIKGVVFSISDNYSKFYENLVYLSLRRQRGIEIFYFHKDFEVDFVVVNKGAINLIQVCYNLDNINILEREKRGLLEAMDIFKKKEGIIINDYLDKEEVVDNKKIKYIPLWKWMINLP